MPLTAREFGVKTSGASSTRFYGSKSQPRHAVHFIPNSVSDKQYNYLCGYKIIAEKHTIRKNDQSLEPQMVLEHTHTHTHTHTRARVYPIFFRQNFEQLKESL
jgi:hypothetical protein